MSMDNFFSSHILTELIICNRICLAVEEPRPPLALAHQARAPLALAHLEWAPQARAPRALAHQEPAPRARGHLEPAHLAQEFQAPAHRQAWETQVQEHHQLQFQELTHSWDLVQLVASAILIQTAVELQAFIEAQTCFTV